MLRWEDLGLFAILLAHSFFLVHPADVALLFLLPQSHSLCFSTGAKNPLSHPFIHFPRSCEPARPAYSYSIFPSARLLMAV
jgi:hypothetical protein